jgi:hypothetical protein
MDWPRGERLYSLLPATVRERDIEQGEPLRALLAAIETEYEKLEDNISGLYDNWFIETCEEWVIAYVADLLRVRPMHSVGSAGVYSLRAYVANTLGYRRRKGTAAVLEQLARDMCGWPARVVEYFQLLSTSQHLNHVRPSNLCSIDLRARNRLELLNSPFDTAAHTLEVRSIGSNRGRYNIRNIGLHLWRLQSYPIKLGTAFAVNDDTDWRYTFSPLGKFTHLFNRPQTETEITHLAEEINVPGRLRRYPLYQELEEQRQALTDGTDEEDLPKMGVYFGIDPVFRVFVGGEEIPSHEILICNLSDISNVGTEPDWPRPPWFKTYKPTGGGGSVNQTIAVAVDPVLGRLAFSEGHEPASGEKVEVSYSYGFSGDVGGGPYNHQLPMPEFENGQTLWQALVSAELDEDDGLFKSLTDALDVWHAQPAGTIGIIAIMDSRSYAGDPDDGFQIYIPRGSHLLITAGQLIGMTVPDALSDIVAASGKLVRPHLKGDVTVADAVGGDPDSESALVMDGLLIQGLLTVSAGKAKTLRLHHCTLAPENGGLVIENGQGGYLSVSLERTICGPIALPDEALGLSIVDSIVDGNVGPTVTDDEEWVDAVGTIRSSTILGTIKLHSLDASECIFDGLVQVRRRQIGCLRFCYLQHQDIIDDEEYNSQTPRRFRCQPDLALAGVTEEDIEERILTRLRPTYTSTVYSKPEYAQLHLACPEEIRTGAEDGSEMGVFYHLKQPQRETNLREALDEYLRFGLEAGIFYVIEED